MLVVGALAQVRRLLCPHPASPPPPMARGTWGKSESGRSVTLLKSFIHLTYSAGQVLLFGWERVSPPSVTLGITPQCLLLCAIWTYSFSNITSGPFPFSPPSPASIAASLPRPSCWLFPDFVPHPSGLSSEVSSLKKASPSPLAKVAFLSHSLSNYSVYIFLTYF